MSRMVCYCKNVNESEIGEAIRNGAKSLKAIQEKTGACTGNQCAELNPSTKCCSGDINVILKATPKEIGRAHV